MRLIDLKKCENLSVENWLIENIPELTVYQKEKIRDNEIVRFAPFYFMERNKKVNNILLRFSIIAIPPILLLLIIGLPFNYFITGKWGYSYKMRWFGKWISACGI
jgi:hypothetical protein